MSGLLEHLVQRTLASSTKVKPRPVSVFEPTAVSPPPRAPSEQARDDLARGLAMDVDMAQADLEHRPDPVRGHDANEPRTRTSQQPVAPLVEPGTPVFPARAVRRGPRESQDTPAFPERSTSIHPIADGGQRQASEADGARRAVGALQMTVIPEAAVRPAAVAQPHIPLQGKPSDPTASRSRDRRPDAHTASTAAVASSSDLAGRVDLSERAAAGRSALAPPRPLPTPLPEPSALQAILQPRLPQPSLAPPPRPSPLEQSVEPVVHVTIGRVEIRAVSLPLAPRRSAPSGTPRLSLGDYLDRRSGGRR